MATAAAASFLLYHAFVLPQGYWAVFTAVIVVQASVGATLNLAFERLVGTIFGALVGAAGAALRPQTPTGLGAALAVCVLVASFGAASRARLKVAPVTAVIMLISPTGASMGPLETAALRVIEIGLGGVVGVLATLLIFPARAQRLAAGRIAAVLDDLAVMIEAAAARLAGEQLEIAGVAVRIRSGIAAVEAAVAEAARERSTRLGEDQLPLAVARTLWRVRNDAVVLSRISEEGLPETAAVRLRDPAQALLRAEAAFARACGAAMASGKAVPREELAAAREGFETGVQAVRRERLTGGLTFDEIRPYFGLVFAAESLSRNLGDLADRIEEAQGRRGP